MFQKNIYLIMGNCCRCKQQPKRKIVLLLVGLDNAGKTVAVKGLAGENLNDSIPTVGFSVVNLKYLDYNVCIYDLGGGPGIRGIWHRYFVDAHGIIFVIDASDYDRFDEVKTVLENLLSHEKISGKPLLILANKQDHQEALDEIDLIEKLDLENLVNEKRCPTLVESCSAKEINNHKVDPGIEKGYKWLLNHVNNNYKTLNVRVENDVEKQRIIEDMQRKEKISRLKLNKNSDNDISEIENDITFVDPFKPIQELVNINGNSAIALIPNEIMNSPTNSIKSCIHYSNGLRENIERPKSAVQIVKKHLENTGRRNSFLSIANNKTAPINLLSPKSAPITKTKKPDFDQPQEFGLTDNFRSASRTGQILTVTELPNAIIDATNGENIGDLFELNNFSSAKKLPPLKSKSNNIEWIKTSKNSVNVIQTNIDEIYKDIS